MYKFVPPASLENPMGYGRLLMRYLTPQGITVIKTGSTYSEVRYPTTDELESADIVYTGGYIHIVSDEEAASLQAAGYEVTAL
jgi:hypothetical protein